MTAGAGGAAAPPIGALGKIALVIRREYMERVRTKAFILGTILVPVLLGGLMLAPFLIRNLNPAKPLRIAVIDGTGSLYAAIDEGLASDAERDFLKPGRKAGASAPKVRRYQLEAVAGDAEASRPALTRRVEDESLDAYLVLPADLLSGEGEPTFYGRTVSDISTLRRIQEAISDVVVARRLATEGVDAERVKALTRRVDIQTVKLGEGGRESRRGFIEEWLVTMVFVMLLYTNLILYGSALARSVIEEKMNRVVEVLLSSLTSFQLMAGKILGIGAVGLTQFLIWSGAALAFSKVQASGSEDGGVTVEPAAIGFFLLFFVLGYFIYAALFCIVGAMCTTEQEAQNAQQPVVMLLVVPLAIALMVVEQPSSAVAVGLSHVPFFSPVIMFMRANILTPPWWELAINIAAQLVTIVALTWAAGKIFRVGVLMTGKRATIPEIVRWIRAD